HPLHAPGPAATSTKVTRSRAEGGTGRRNKTPIPRLGGTAKGTEVACGCPHRVEPHAGGITHGRLAFRGPESSDQLEYLLQCCNPGIRAGNDNPSAGDHLFHSSLRSRCPAMLSALRTLIQPGTGPIDKFRLPA